MKRLLPVAAAVAAALVGVVIAVTAKPAPPPPDPAVPTFPSSATPTPEAPPDITLAVVAYAPDRRITGAQPPACVVRARGMLPDPACTPGAIAATADPNDDPAKPAGQAEVCNAGFSDRHRPIGTGKAKVAAMEAYNVPTTDIRVVEYDHLVPLSLGGANDVRNLWPQRSDLLGQGFHNSKDEVETRLWRAVCTGPAEKRLKLADVQLAFARDWTAAEKFLGTSPR